MLYYRFVRRWSLLTACVLIFGGCRPSDRAEVAGLATLDGKPLPTGLVTFRPAPGTLGPEFSGRIADGQYRVLMPVLPGNYVVDVRSWQKTGRTVKSPFGQDTDEIVNAVPERYFGPKTELSAQLHIGQNKLDFDLAP